MRQVWFPLLAAVGAVVARALIHRYAMRWKRPNAEQETRLVRAIESSSTPLLFLAALYLICSGLPLQRDTIHALQQGLGIAIIAVAVGAVSRILTIAADLWKSRNPSMDRYIHPIQALITGVTLLVGIAVALKVLALDFTEEGQRLTRIAGIVLGAYFAIRIAQIVIAKLESIVAGHEGQPADEASRRARTLGRALNNVAWVMVVAISGIMALSEFGLNIMPIVTGAGIVGIALGLGAQNLVRDVIGGFFLILENQVRVGDVASINGTSGSVEAINLRTIVLRDARGAVHVFPNGGIQHVSNMTKEWSRCLIDLPLSYDQDIDRAIGVLAETGEEFAADPIFGPQTLERMEVFGVEDFGENSVTVRVAIKTLPLKQWMVGRELRRRIKTRFDREGIRVSGIRTAPAAARLAPGKSLPEGDSILG
ncbi:MAG TPA: mechanosensitive ion channel family protein [Terriglobia bacterium]|nr:mechanosensitive ion channel family protein [Terriglobia bacterium]